MATIDRANASTEQIPVVNEATASGTTLRMPPVPTTGKPSIMQQLRSSWVRRTARTIAWIVESGTFIRWAILPTALVVGLAISTLMPSVRDAVTPEIFADTPRTTVQPDAPRDKTRQPATPRAVQPVDMPLAARPTATSVSPSAKPSMTAKPSASASTTSSSPTPSPTTEAPDKDTETTPTAGTPTPPASPSVTPTPQQTPENTPPPTPDETTPAAGVETSAATP